MGSELSDSLPDLTRKVVQISGDRGEEWLARLPEMIADCEVRWSVRAADPFRSLSYNYVAPCTMADGTEAVLKLGVPHRELLTEIEALRLYDGQGCTRLFEADPAICAMVIERVYPGTPLSALEDDDAATAIAAEVMQQLWRPAPIEHPFPTVADWSQGLARLRDRFGGDTGPLPRRLVDEAEGLFADLLATEGAPKLLHGDLHHDNILAADRAPWLAIDPKGVVGEPEYDVACLLRNPDGRVLRAPDPVAFARRRTDILSVRLGFNRERIRGWAIAQTVLSAWWCIEDNSDCLESAIACAEVMARV
jgi:streptomycin 6-kinase